MAAFNCFKQDIIVKRTASGFRDAFSISIGLALIAMFGIIAVLKLKTSVVSPRQMRGYNPFFF